MPGVSQAEMNTVDMTWGTFLSLVLLFTKNEETNKLLNVMEIYTDEFHAFIQRPSAGGK